MLNQLDSIKKLVSEDLDAVEHLISNHLSAEIMLIEQLCHHLIGGGGKRLRPLMLLLAAKACGYEDDNHIQLAAAVEYFHTATLLHDDVVDESALRRGRKTANEIWGGKACILVGDYLFTQSFRWMVSSQNLGILDLFAQTAYLISRGEVKQLSLRHHTDVKIEDYFEVIRSKTALLFSASAEVGARLSGCGPEINEALRDYGLHLGNAFQMIDDALDYCSSADVLGKNIGDDLADGKMTLPLFCAMNYGNEQQAAIIKESVKKGSLDNLPDILKIIQDTKAIDYTYELANKEANYAIAALDMLPNSPYKQALIDLVHFSVARIN